jgi:ankyrin repeat protein
VIKLLLDQIDIIADLAANCGATPLSQASEYGHVAVVRLLLDQDDVDPSSRNDHGCSVLSIAAFHRQKEVVSCSSNEKRLLPTLGRTIFRPHYFWLLTKCTAVQ